MGGVRRGQGARRGGSDPAGTYSGRARPSGTTEQTYSARSAAPYPNEPESAAAGVRESPGRQATGRLSSRCTPGLRRVPRPRRDHLSISTANFGSRPGARGQAAPGHTRGDGRPAGTFLLRPNSYRRRGSIELGKFGSFLGLVRSLSNLQSGITNLQHSNHVRGGSVRSRPCRERRYGAPRVNRRMPSTPERVRKDGGSMNPKRWPP